MISRSWPSRLCTDFWTGVGAIAIAVVSLYAASKIFVPRTISGFLGPQVFPIAVAAALAGLGVVLVTRALIRPRHEAESVGSKRDLTILVGAIVAYLVLFQGLGFLLSTFLLLSAMFYYLGERRVWVAVVVAGCMSVIVMLLFRDGLSVKLPVGYLGV